MNGSRFWRSRRGVSAVEYIVLMGLISIIALTVVTTTGSGVNRGLEEISTTLDPSDVPTAETTTTESCDPNQYNVTECTPFHEAIDECDVESLAVGEACPGTNLVYAGPISGTRFYTYNPNLPGLTPPNFLPDPQLAWDTVDANSGNFYAVGYGGNARNHIDIIRHPRAHPAADYCESMGSYLPSPEQMDMMELNAAALGFPQSPPRIYQTSSQYWPGFGGFNPAPIGEPLNYAFLNTMGGSVGASQHGFVTHDFFVRCITDLRNLYDDPALWLYGTSADDGVLQLTGQLGVYGYEGIDTLRGTGRGEILNGGPGNDILWGGSGDDTYVFEPGFGTDTLDDGQGGSSGGGADILQFDGMNLADFTFTPTGGSLRDIRVQHTSGNSVTVIGMRYVDNDRLIEGLQFADTGLIGTTSMRGIVVASQEATGIVRGFYQDDSYEVDATDPSFDIVEYGGTDTITFVDSASSDWRFTNSGGRDLEMYNPSTGQYINIIDQFYVSNSDYVENFVFTDTSFNRQGSIDKAAADAVAQGGTLTGTTGNDVYPVYSNGNSFTLQETGGTDRMEFPDSASTDWSFASTGRDMLLTHNSTGLNIRIFDQYYVSSNEYVESFVFTDVTMTRVGTIPKTHTDQMSTGTLQGTYASDTVNIPLATSNSFTWQERGGTDAFVFPDSASTDWQFDSTGRNMILRHAGSGITITMYDQRYVSSSEYTDSFQFTDTTLSRAQANQKANVDQIASGGNIYGTYSVGDTFTVPLSFASFHLYEYGGTDTMVFPDSASTDWTFRNTSRDLVATHIASGRSFTIDDQFYVSSGDFVESFAFTDTTLSRAGAVNKAYEDQSSAGAFVYAAYNFNDVYALNTPFTSFQLREQSGTDRIVFDTPEADWTFTDLGRDMLMTHNASGNTVRLVDHLYVSSSRYVENFQFTDVTLDRAGSIAKITP